MLNDNKNTNTITKISFSLVVISRNLYLFKLRVTQVYVTRKEEVVILKST